MPRRKTLHKSWLMAAKHDISGRIGCPEPGCFGRLEHVVDTTVSFLTFASPPGSAPEIADVIVDELSACPSDITFNHRFRCRSCRKEWNYPRGVGYDEFPGTTYGEIVDENRRKQRRQAADRRRAEKAAGKAGK